MNSRKGSIYNSRKGSLFNETVKSNGTKAEVPNSAAILQAVGQDIIVNLMLCKIMFIVKQRKIIQKCK